jgi:hypothetical protein
VSERLGKRQQECLAFIEQVNGWHTFAKDVRRVVLSLEARGLVEVSKRTSQFRLVRPMRCDQCQMLSINGVACHETGCPNSRKTWDADRGEWLRLVECSQCGAEFYDCDSHDCEEA